MISAENRDYKLEFQPVTGGEGLQHSLIIQKLSHSHTQTAKSLTDIFRNMLLVAQKIDIINSDFLKIKKRIHFTS